MNRAQRRAIASQSRKQGTKMSLPDEKEELIKKYQEVANQMVQHQIALTALSLVALDVQRKLETLSQEKPNAIPQVQEAALSPDAIGVGNPSGQLPPG